tara:strand:- start:6 stop:470 length:465 start_codon:yes stop_codon:yes gene_type:complete
MSNPMYGQNKNDELLRDVIDMFRPDQIGKVEGKGFCVLKGTKTISNTDTTSDQGIIIPVGTDTSVWGGFVRVEGIPASDAGAIDFDLGLVAEGATLGAAYGDAGNGVYALKLHDFIDISTPEDVHLSIDANTLASTTNVKITVVLLTAVAPATS